MREVSMDASKRRRGRGRRHALAAAAMVVAAWCLVCSSGAIAAPVTHTVVIEGVKYEPETLTVKRGETVVWVNKDPFPHTVTAKGAFDSHDIAAGKSWKYTTRKAGEYAYICTLHPNMKGTLKVD
jgi:plastocyanin